MKHTPGPWKTQGQGIYTTCGRTETLKSGRVIKMRIACGKDAGGEMSLGEVQANARLIASAPDLLSALEASQAALDLACAARGARNERSGGKKIQANARAALREARTKARAAVAKAKGKEDDI